MPFSPYSKFHFVSSLQCLLPTCFSNLTQKSLFFFWSPNTFFPITSPSLRFFRFSALPSLYFAYCLFYFVGFNCATVLTVSSSVYLPWILSLFSIHVVFLDVSPIFWSNFSSEPSHVFLCGAQLSLLLFPTGELCLQPASS